MTELPSTIRIFGTGGFAADLANAAQHRGITIAGFVQTTPSAPTFCGKPVAALSTFNKSDSIPLWVGVYNHTFPSDYGSLVEQLAARFEKVVFPMAFYPALHEELGPRYWLDAVPSERMLQVKSLFADEHSKTLVERIIAFRRGDPKAMHDVVTSGSQYFIPEVLKALPAAVRWVDAGAFDGDTLADSTKYFTSASVTAFEPDLANLTKLRDRVASLELPLWVLPLGLSDHNGFASFEAGMGGASSTVFGDGTTTIALAKLDDVLPTQKIDFLKVDVEGADLDVVRGAKQLITRSQPIIAMAAYHAPEHLSQVPELLRSFLPKHRLLLRTHAANTFDTICYAIPTA